MLLWSKVGILSNCMFGRVPKTLCPFYELLILMIQKFHFQHFPQFPQTELMTFPLFHHHTLCISKKLNFFSSVCYNYFWYFPSLAIVISFLRILVIFPKDIFSEWTSEQINHKNTLRKSIILYNLIHDCLRMMFINWLLVYFNKITCFFLPTILIYTIMIRHYMQQR